MRRSGDHSINFAALREFAEFVIGQLHRFVSEEGLFGDGTCLRVTPGRLGVVVDTDDDEPTGRVDFHHAVIERLMPRAFDEITTDQVEQVWFRRASRSLLRPLRRAATSSFRDTK